MEADFGQVSSGCNSMAVGISVVYYLLTVAFAWATSYRASSCIQYGQRAGFRAWEWAMDAEGKRVNARNI